MCPIGYGSTQLAAQHQDLSASFLSEGAFGTAMSQMEALRGSLSDGYKIADRILSKTYTRSGIQRTSCRDDLV
jgi:hypothetical protein